MSEKASEFKRQLLKAGLIGLAGLYLEYFATTDYMHRDVTHRAYKLHEPFKTIARTVLWGNGMRPRTYAQVHRRHHKFADQPGDPHSPILQGKFGVSKLFIKNTSLYKKDARGVEAANIYDADLQSDELDKKVFDKVKLGLAADFAGHVVLNKMVGNPSYMGAVSWGIEKVGYLMGSSAVNSGGHAGRSLPRAIFTGEIEPNEDGTYATDSPSIALLVVGEGNQRYHHDHPGSLYFGPDPEGKSLVARAARDLGGTIALALVKAGYAELNTESPTRAA